MKRIALPFLTLSDEAVTLDEWSIGEPDQPRFPMEDIHENWDYEKDLEISVVITVDFNIAEKELALVDKDLELAAVLMVGTGAGTVCRSIHRACSVLLNRSNNKARLIAKLNGHLLSSQLHLDARILFDQSATASSRLAPSIKGSKLWARDRRVLLEDGGSSRFPIELASFSETFQGRAEQNAPWYVHWDPSNLHADFGGNVRLYVNSDNAEVTERFAAGDRLLLQAIVSDVMTQMMIAGLDNEEDWLSSYEEGSVGQQIRAWIDEAFRGHTLESVKALRKSFPGRFHASILATAELGREE